MSHFIQAGPVDTVTVTAAGGPFICVELHPRGFVFLRPEEARALAITLGELADKWIEPLRDDPRQLPLIEEK